MRAREIDTVRDDIASEETALLKLLVGLQESGEDPQAVCDSLPRTNGNAPFNAYRALVGGRSGIPENPKGLTVRRRLIDALEARQRAQATPFISDSNRQMMESLKRVGDKIMAKQATERKEIAG